ncbi:MAG: YciI family protein [Planctomycetota bacterium]
MKFMLLMQGNLKGFEKLMTWKPEEFAAHVRFMKDFVVQLRESGELVMAEGLDLPMHAKVVSAKSADAPVVSDGPFPETKEFLAGFWIVDVASAERAIEIAAAASVAPGPGGAPMAIPIEVRQVMEAPEV